MPISREHGRRACDQERLASLGIHLGPATPPPPASPIREGDEIHGPGIAPRQTSPSIRSSGQPSVHYTHPEFIQALGLEQAQVGREPGRRAVGGESRARADRWLASGCLVRWAWKSRSERSGML